MSNRAQNHLKSTLLSDLENESIFNVLGRGCFSLATCVAQLYVVQSARKRQKKWMKKCCGAVCFVKDNRKKSYFIRIYDPMSQKMLWEQELYTRFIYNTPKEFFHTFEAHDCHVGLNFASEDEAVVFQEVIEEKLTERNLKRLQREQRRQERQAALNVPPEEILHEEIPKENESTKQEDLKTGPTEQYCKDNVTTEVQSPTVQVDTKEKEQPKTFEDKTLHDTINMRKKKKTKKRKLTKDDVGIPSDFRHISHLSWDANEGPHMERLDSDMKGLLEQIGIKEKSQVDQDTMNFIYDFVDKHGGVDVVKEDFKSWKKSADMGEVADQLPAGPSHPVGEMQSAAPAESNMQPTSGIKVMDSIPANVQLHPTRPPSPKVEPPKQKARPPSPKSKPPQQNARPPSLKSKPLLQKPRPPSPKSKPPRQSGRPPTSTEKPVESSSGKQETPKETLQTSQSAKSSTVVLNKTPPGPKMSNVSRLSKGKPPAPPPSDIPKPPPLPALNTPRPPKNNAVSVPAPSNATTSSDVTSSLPASPSLAPSNNSRAGLLNEIQTFKGASLNHVTPTKGTSSRDVLLKEIRTGTLLRHVDTSREPAPQKRGSIAAALMSQLIKRKTIIQFSDNEESSDEFDDDWDD